MSAASIIRYVLILGILFLPFLHVANFLFYMFIPLLIVWDNSCDCTDCPVSNWCARERRIKWVKTLLVFCGYSKESFDKIECHTYNCDNSFWSVLKYYFREIKKNEKQVSQ